MTGFIKGLVENKSSMCFPPVTDKRPQRTSLSNPILLKIFESRLVETVP